MIAEKPVWGDLVFFADHDLLSFALLYSGGLAVPAMFHATQALEKYLKGLAVSLALTEPAHADKTLDDFIWLRTMDIGYLAQKCGGRLPFYRQQGILDNLYRFSRFDWVSRYPWMVQHCQGFTADDLNPFHELIHRLRNDIPIIIDDFPLGLLVRGYSMKDPEKPLGRPIADLQRIAVAALKKTFAGVNEIIRW